MNEQHIEDLITVLYDTIQDAKSVPLSADKCILERDRILDMLDEIIAAGAVSDTHLRMLIQEIIINEKNGKLKIKIQIKAKFSSHIDFIPDEDDPMYQNMDPYLIEK